MFFVDEAFEPVTETPEHTPETLSEMGNYLAADHERQATEMAGKIEEQAYETLKSSKAERAKRNRKAGAARAREALAAKKAKEKDSVQVD